MKNYLDVIYIWQRFKQCPYYRQNGTRIFERHAASRCPWTWHHAQYRFSFFAGRASECGFGGGAPVGAVAGARAAAQTAAQSSNESQPAKGRGLESDDWMVGCLLIAINYYDSFRNFLRF